MIKNIFRNLLIAGCGGLGVILFAEVLALSFWFGISLPVLMGILESLLENSVEDKKQDT